MRLLFLLSVPVLLWAGSAAAQDTTGVGLGFLDGFLKPLRGLDHAAAMVAVGMWGAILGAPAVRILPIAFPVMMAIGAALATAGLSLPLVDTAIAASAVVIGLAVAAAYRPPVIAAAAIVGVFAVFHGHAHGAEMPEGANPLVYGLGFVIATVMLHLGGTALGELAVTAPGRLAVRAMGGVIALGGVGFLTGVL